MATREPAPRCSQNSAKRLSARVCGFGTPARFVFLSFLALSLSFSLSPHPSPEDASVIALCRLWFPIGCLYTLSPLWGIQRSRSRVVKIDMLSGVLPRKGSWDQECVRARFCSLVYIHRKSIFFPCHV